ncbi:MAG: hypothetical protein AAF391_08085 [Bacteroidota bacterium]
MNNEIILGDKKYPIKFNYMVLAQIERESEHKNILNEIDELGVYDAILMAYLGCKAADKDFALTMEEVGELFKSETLVEVFKFFIEDMGNLNSDSEKK